MKYLVRPSEPEPMNLPKPLTKDYLRELVKKRIANKPASFDFFLQKRLIDGHEDKKMPVENNAVTWDEEKSVPVLVAKLTIPAQDADALDEQWRIVGDVLDRHDPVSLYADGSMGPTEADELAADVGGWVDPEG